MDWHVARIVFWVIVVYRVVTGSPMTVAEAAIAIGLLVSIGVGCILSKLKDTGEV